MVPFNCNLILMNKYIALLGLLLVVVPTLAQNSVVGVKVPIRILNNVHSDEMGTVNACVENNIYIDDILVIKRGTPVEVNVARHEHKGGGKPGTLTLNFIGTKTVDQKQIVLKGEYTYRGKSKRGIAYGVGIGVGIFVWPCLGFLAYRGGEVCLPANTIVYDVTIASPL